jgi:hypothetical protein
MKAWVTISTFCESFVRGFPHLCYFVSKKYWEIWENGTRLIHLYNLHLHAALPVVECLVKHSISVVPNLLYLPDLAPCDFFLFPKHFLYYYEYNQPGCPSHKITVSLVYCSSGIIKQNVVNYYVWLAIGRHVSDEWFWRKFVDLDSDSDNEVSDCTLHDTVVNYDSDRNSKSVQGFICKDKKLLVTWACNDGSEGMVHSVQKKIKCWKISKSETKSDVNVQLASWFQSFVISLYLSICGFSIPFIDYNYLCQMSVKQRHQYVCLIWRTTWINVNDFSKKCEQVPWQNRGEDYFACTIYYRLCKLLKHSSISLYNSIYWYIWEYITATTCFGLTGHLQVIWT